VNNGNRAIKPVSEYDLGLLGISKSSLRVVKDLEELKLSPHNVVIAEAQKSMEFMQNFSKKQKLIKKQKYVMGLATFEQLHIDPRLPKLKLLKPSIKFSAIYKPYNGEDLSNKTILIWRTGGIGDLLFIQPNLIYIKEKYPTCKIIFACGPQYQPMVKLWPFVDEVLDLPFSFSHLLKSDYHIIFEGVIERTKEAETTNALKLFTRWMNINLPDEKLVPHQEPKQETINECKKVLEGWNIKENEFILMQLKASSPIRTPSNSVWKKVVESLIDDGHKIIITDGPHNSHVIDSFMNTLDTKHKNVNVFNFSSHSKTLDYTIALCSLAKLVVGTDSALLHIAASVKAPAMGIYGPFPGEIRLSTYPRTDWVNCKRECAPCFMHGPNPCRNSKNGHSLCYENIDIEEFKNKIKGLLTK
jgi:ADP-heptose:LPS heptosyltransferase